MEEMKCDEVAQVSGGLMGQSLREFLERIDREWQNVPMPANPDGPV